MNSSNGNKTEELDMSEYIVNDKIVTIIGEHHGLTKSIYVDQYLRLILSKLQNPRTVLFLEFGEDDPSISSSILIRRLFQVLTDTNRKNLMYGFDVRSRYLTVKNHVDLYRMKKISSTKSFVEKYVHPFWKNMEEILDINSKIYNDEGRLIKSANILSKEETYFLKEVFGRDISLIFKFILKNEETDNARVKSLILEAAKLGWSKVVDFNILAQILKEGRHFNHFIILVGKTHKNNLDFILKNYKKTF